MKQLIATLAALTLGAALLAGCSASSTNQSYTFDMEDLDETITVELDATSGFELSQANNFFIVSQDGEQVLFGSFISADARDHIIEAVIEAEEAGEAATQILENKNTDELFCWMTMGEEGREYDRLVAIPGASAYAYMGALVGSDLNKNYTADDAFEALTFTKE